MMLVDAWDDRKRAGYFRIGHVILPISPSDISTNKVTADEEIIPLRAKYAMHRKTGHSRWDATIRFRAIADNGDFSQWEALRTVLAIFKAAPFVEVENQHLRQIIMSDPDSGTDSSSRMAFALRMLRIDTIADIPMGLDATLSMSWFNYRPFSFDFGYADSAGMACDAYQSGDFASYISTWMAENLDRAPSPFSNRPDLAAKYGYPDMPAWTDQTAGSMTFSWRTYTFLPRESGGIQPAAPYSGPRSSSPPSRPQGNSGKKKPMQPIEPPPAIKTCIVNAAQSWGVDPNLCLAVSQRESTFNPSAKNPTSSATGLFQLVAGTARQYGCSDVTDPRQNALAGCQYISKLMQMFHKDTTMALTAFAGGEGNVKKLGVQGTWKKYPWIPGWLDDIGNIYSKLSGNKLPVTGAPVAAASVFAQPDTSATQLQANTMKAEGVPDDVVSLSQPWLAQGWSMDHYTERAVFLYQEHTLDLVDEEHGRGPNDQLLLPTQTSVVFINNIAAVPLAGYQYPTYQHIGPAGTMITVGLQSYGDVQGDEEPVHPGLNALSGMCSSLESQFQRLRGEWRSLTSIHRMQSVIVENQVLNMLGIRGTLVRGLTTETVPESSNLVEAGLNLTQYENVYEEIEPFRVKGSAQTYQTVLDQMKQGGLLDQIVKDKPNSIFQPLLKYRDQVKTHDPAPLLEMLQDTKYACPAVPIPIQLSQQELLGLQTIAAKPAMQDNAVGAGLLGALSAYTGLAVPVVRSWAEMHPAIAKRINSGNCSYNDYYLLVNNPWLATQPDVSSLRNQIEQEIGRQNADGKLPMDKLYDQLLDYQATQSNYGMARALQEFEFAPEVQQQIKQGVQQNGPGLDKDNADHGAYRDLGLQSIAVGGKDFNPGYYFVDYGRAKQDQLQAVARTAATVAVSAANAFNVKQATSTLDLQSAVAVGMKQDGTSAAARMDGSPGNAAFDPTSTVEAILSKTVIPYYSMTRAFPTYKLFLAEEDNSGPFYMFDNFYSYGSVLSIEVSRHQDQPDLAVITLTNFANLLTHRLFDGSVVGRCEKSLSNLQEVPDNSNADATTGGVQGKLTATRSWLGAIRQRNQVLNLTQGFSPAVDTPLQYYPLQTGGKVQIRMGFSNNPDKLWPVFTGKITQIEGDDVLQVVCQGYMLELMDPAPEDLKYDGYTNLSLFSQLAQSGVQVAKSVLVEHKVAGITDLTLGPGAAYGGMSILRDSGHTESVMESVLKTSGAKHFGHWQIDPGRQNSKFIKGFGWMELAGLAAGAVGADKLSTLMMSGRDRRGENILINRFTNVDGSNTDVRLTRPMQYEQPLNTFSALYHVPKDPSITPWRIIKDISRRYAEYILKIAPYGFPVGCDATLVFANPNDFYVSSKGLGDKLQVETLTDTDDAKFREWWHNRGWAKFQAWAKQPAGGAFRLAAQQVLAMVSPGAAAGSRFLADALLTDNPVAKWTSWTDPAAALALTKKIDSGGVHAFDEIMTKFAEVAGVSEFFSKFALHSDSKAESERLLAEIRMLLNDLQNYLQLIQARQEGLVTDPRPGDRIQPVRRWHLVNQESILHNGIRLNDQIFNSVRVDREVFKANAAIPDFHSRTLDCDRTIIEPVKNVRAAGLGKSYAQSFLREELGKMYRGELVLALTPEIEPFDVVLLYDPATGMAGPVEVDTVVHSFDQENGAITVITPRALVVMNEAMTAGLLAALGGFFSNMGAELSGLAHDITQNPAQGVAQAATAAGKAAVLKTGTWLAGVGLAAAGFTIGAPVTLTIAAAMVAFKLLYLADNRQSANPVFVAPLNRFGRPWVGGLQGWALDDLHTLAATNFQRMWNFEVAPTIEGFKRLNQIAQSDF